MNITTIIQGTALVLLIIGLVSLIKILYERHLEYERRVKELRRRENLTTTTREPGQITNTSENTNTNTQVPSATEETGRMIYFANDHHGREDKEYQFNFKKVEDSWRAYILRMPSLEGRCEDATITHRLGAAGNYYVCWDRPVTTLKDMQTISRIWADNIQEYIATGRPFE